MVCIVCVFSFGYCRLVCTDTVLQWSSLEEKDSAARFRFSMFDLLWLRHGNLHLQTSTVQMVNILWMQLQLIVLSQLIQTHLPKTLSWMGLETLSVLLFALLHETSVNLKCCKCFYKRGADSLLPSVIYFIVTAQQCFNKSNISYWFT